MPLALPGSGRLPVSARPRPSGMNRPYYGPFMIAIVVWMILIPNTNSAWMCLYPESYFLIRSQCLSCSMLGAISSVDLRNPWIALRNLWIHTLRRNPWIAQESVDLDCLRDLPVLRTGGDRPAEYAASPRSPFECVCIYNLLP